MQLRADDRTSALGWASVAGAAFLALHFILRPFSKRLFNATECLILISLLFINGALSALPMPLSQGARICKHFLSALLLELEAFCLLCSAGVLDLRPCHPSGAHGHLLHAEPQPLREAGHGREPEGPQRRRHHEGAGLGERRMRADRPILSEISPFNGSSTHRSI